MAEEKTELNESNAFVVYGGSGQPLAYFFKTTTDNFTEDEMAAMMKLFPKAKDNAETWIEWREET